MKLFSCQSCDQILFFENTHCGSCGHSLGFDSEAQDLLTLEPDGENGWKPVGAPEAPSRFLCSNARHGVCNWLVPPDDQTGGWCVACRHNRVIPDLSLDDNLKLWSDIEVARHRLFYTLIVLNLPLPTRAENPESGLVFDFPNDAPDVMTGHDEGVITIALKEADPVEREKMRVSMGEYYRTLLGHFRHEIGHFYWNVLVRDAGKAEACKAVFGDHDQDYGAALREHYENGPPPDWQNNYVSSYATTHAWEDFAETWAHYLHIVDTMQTAMAYGMVIRPKIDHDSHMSGRYDFDPYHAGAFEQIISAWLPLTYATNSLARSMGQPDVYPFVLPEPVIGKMRFIHELVHGMV
ncbi:putative zinc-binding peptidase [Acetobacter sp. AN02]|uniref:zinc-binding metallopeptidase family protein n=1 Tax=Acetobacter sp. AN02 TaxID=2894186 RepID=UPI0024343F06|nr:putative zinc-binding peptidase [Acetobacter sp. AN02]MDG6094953.1 putative zinc-binding peptidase [Acetobacter sp. AN02]